MKTKTRRSRRPVTPKATIKAGLSQIWLRSRERRHALKTQGSFCQVCGEVENLHVHHNKPVDWQRIFAVLKEELLNDDLKVLCRQCHAIVTEGQREGPVIFGLKCVGGVSDD